MSRRKKTPEHESYETAEGFQIEDMEGNPVADEVLLEDPLLEVDSADDFWDEDEEEDEVDEDEHFNSIAEENNWEEGYDY